MGDWSRHALDDWLFNGWLFVWNTLRILILQLQQCSYERICRWTGRWARLNFVFERYSNKTEIWTKLKRNSIKQKAVFLNISKDFKKMRVKLQTVIRKENIVYFKTNRSVDTNIIKLTLFWCRLICRKQM